MRTLLIDNYDSFTYNLFHALERVCGTEPRVVRNDDWTGLGQIALSEVDAVVVSPGPGTAERECDFGLSRWAIRQAELPVLGVCLGHQGMWWEYGAKIVRASPVMHGRVSQVFHNGDSLFDGIPSPFEAVRYHSLTVEGLPECGIPLAHTADNVLMAAKHRKRRQWSVQFHPESIATDHGVRLLANFRDLVGASRGRHRRAVTSTQPPEPVYRLEVEPIPAPRAEAAFEALFRHEDQAFWLDSSRVVAGLSRFSILGSAAGPLSEVVSYSRTGGVVVVRDGVSTVHDGDIFSYVDKTLSQRALPDAGLPCDFNLGYVGYLGYELKADCGARAAHASRDPDAVLVFCDRALVIDHHTDEAWLLALGDATYDPREWLRQARGVLARPRELEAVPEAAAELSVSPRHGRTGYAKLIDECQRQIALGESYEICLTNTLTLDGEVDPWTTYRRLRRDNPAPFAALLNFGDVAVLSSSPERFLRVGVDRVVESKPIKGTRPRGHDPHADAALRRDLVDSQKERAENLMIVDLVRNDIGRVAAPGTVEVPVLFGIETYQTVHQMVSTVRGRLRTESSVVECVKAAFPGGSMTGAPKLRTMEILDTLEDGPRGIYSGALGYFSLNGAVDLSIVIRTLVVSRGRATLGVGGAITALSQVAEEIAETETKAAALLGAASAVDGGWLR